MNTLISILILAAIFPSLNQAQTARHPGSKMRLPTNRKERHSAVTIHWLGIRIYRTGRWTNSSIRSIRVTAISAP